MIINIDRDVLFTSIIGLSSFVGKVEYNKDGQSLYNVIKIKEQDKFLINQHIDLAVFNLTNKLIEFITSVANTSISCEFPKSFNIAFEDEVKKEAIKYIENYAFSKWLLLTIPDRAKEYENIAEQSVSDMLMKIYHRKAPIKRTGWI